MITLKTPYLGYRRGELTGKYSNNQYEIKLSSGLLIWLYEDDFDKD